MDRECGLTNHWKCEARDFSIIGRRLVQDGETNFDVGSVERVAHRPVILQAPDTKSKCYGLISCDREAWEIDSEIDSRGLTRRCVETEKFPIIGNYV
jgi:hypothetical protein